MATAPSYASNTPAVQSWEKLAGYITRWYYRPDLEALRIALAVGASHQEAADPVWLFVTGAAASGKTAIVINCLNAFPGAMILGDLTTKALLSGSKEKNDSLLVRAGPNPLLLFKDFTTILSKRDDDQKEIASQLREIWDGLYIRDPGRGGNLRWQGKATIIAACTPALERAWAMHRDLGERFLQVRWQSSNSSATAEAARKQRGHEKEIARTMNELTKEFYSHCSKIPALSSEQGAKTDSISLVVAWLRQSVVRNAHGERKIIDTSAQETPSRIAKGLDSIACHHAALFNREVGELDLAGALRVALDTVPFNRSKIIQAIPPNAPQSTAEILNLTGLLRSALQWHTDEMEAIGVLTVARDKSGNTFSMSNSFRDLWTAM